MPLTLRTASALSEPEVVRLLDAAFERSGRESRLVEALERGDPRFDPGLSLLAYDDDQQPVGYALFLPREFRLRGCWVPLAVSAPMGTVARARGRGVGRLLLDTGAAALVDRGVRGAVVLGARAFFEAHGYAPAFNFYALRARRADLPDDTGGEWRALAGEDLPALVALHGRAYGETEGTERRIAAAIDWECVVAGSHTVVSGALGEPTAYVRFRVGERLEVRECAARDPRGVEAVLGFLRRLADEHGRSALDAVLPPRHPVARALFQRGCLQTGSDFGGAAMLRVVDWAGLLADLAPSFEPALRATGGAPLSIELGGRPWRFTPQPGGGLTVSDGRCAGAHLAPPIALGPSLMTGQRSGHDLEWDAATLAHSELDQDGWARVRALFPPATPSWSWAPLFELAED